MPVDMDWSLTLTWLFGVATLVSLGFTVLYGRKANELERARKKLEWSDLQSSAADLANDLSKAGFIPDALFTPSLRGATFANLLLGELEREVPVFVGVASWKEAPGAVQAIKGYFCIETNKWYVHVPESLVDLTQANLLIVDDFAMSGDFLARLSDALRSRGFTQQQVRTMCVVTTKVARHNRKSPDFFWMETSDDSFYFPWGRAR